MAATPIVPAPWPLRGESYIQILANPVVEVYPLLPRTFEAISCRGYTLGALIYVHYTETPVGPYEELLYMPARVRCKGRNGYCVTHIWVDSPDSVASGRENWLLPKQLGRMVYRAEGRVREAAVEKGDGNILAQMRFECPPFPPPLPAHSILFPMPLLQQRQEQTVFVPFGGWGFGQPVSGGFVIKDPESLPVPPRAKRLPAVRLADFRLTFRRAVEL